MPQLTPMKLEDGTIIYIEAAEDVLSPSPITAYTEDEIEEVEEISRREKGIVKDTITSLRKITRHHVEQNDAQGQIIPGFQAVEGTIRAYTTSTLNAFKNIAIADINKVTLEFGVEVGGEAGVPYVTKGTAKSNLKITVECSFPQPEKES